MNQMKNKSKLVEVLDDLVDAENQNDFSIVTYRTTQKTATMIELMSIILQKPVSTLFTSLVSEKLYEMALSHQANVKILEEFFETDRPNSGLIKRLEQEGIIEKDYHFLIGELLDNKESIKDE